MPDSHRPDSNSQDRPSAPTTWRFASRADLAALVELEEAAFPDPWSPDSVAQSLADERIFVVVAERMGTVEGYGVAWTVGDEGEITHLAVLPSLRRQGIGALLLQALLQECYKRGAVRIFLEVRPSNTTARHLYERHGFARVGLRRHYYRDGEDALLLRCDLI